MKTKLLECLGFLPRAICGILHHRKPKGETMTKEELKFKFIIPATGANPDAEFRFDETRRREEGDAIRSSDDPFRPNWYQELLCGESMLLDNATNMESDEFAAYFDRICAPFKGKVKVPENANEAEANVALFCGAFRSDNIPFSWAVKQGMEDSADDETKRIWSCQRIIDAYFREKPVREDEDKLETFQGYTY